MKNRNPYNRGLAAHSTTWMGLCTITFSLLAAMPAAQAASATWSATPVDDLWSTEANWSATPVPGAGDTATFGTNTVAATINTGTISLGTLNFTGVNGSTYTIGGATAGTGQITFADGTTSAVTQSNQTNVTINANIVLGTAAASTTSFGTGNNRNLTLAGSITVGTDGTPEAKTLAIAPFNSAPSSVTISGAITDNANSPLKLTKTGPSTLTLSNAGNSFTGGFTAGSGQTNVSSLAALGSATTGLITLGTGNQAAAILNFTGSPGSLSRQVQIGSSGGTGGATINNNATNGSSPLIFTNALFNVQVGGTGGATRVLTLGGANTDANEIQGVIRNNTNGLIAVTKAGAGTWTLSGGNTYSAGTILNQGTLTVGTAGTLGAVTGALAVNNTNTGAGTDAVLNLSTGADTTVGSLSGTIAMPTTGTNTATITTQTTRNFTVNQTAAGSYSGVIAGAGSFTLGSLSTNTLTLSGANTYTGATTVTTGTLLINGDSSGATGTVTVNGGTLGGTGSIGGAVTVTADGSLAPGNSGVDNLILISDLTVTAQASGSGKLNFELDTIAASDKITVAGTLNIGSGVLGFSDFNFSTLAGLTNGTYPLISGATGLGVGDALDATNLTGTLGAGPAQGELQLSGNDLVLVVTGAGASDPFLDWTNNNPSVLFDGDENNDGVENGLAWLLGAASPNDNATGLLPTATQNGGNLTLNFDMLPTSARGTAQLFIEHSSDLGIGDAWTSVLVPDATGGADPVTFAVSGTDPLDVVITISSSQAAGGKLFSRLRAVK